MSSWTDTAHPVGERRLMATPSTSREQSRMIAGEQREQQQQQHTQNANDRVRRQEQQRQQQDQQQQM